MEFSERVFQWLRIIIDLSTMGTGIDLVLLEATHVSNT